MSRKMLLVMGVNRLLFPEKVLETGERLLLVHPEQCTLKSWAIPAARIEGLCYLLIAWRGGSSVVAFRKALSVIGAISVLFPGRLLSVTAAMLYENPEHCEWKRFVAPLVRLFGVVYLLISIDEFRTKSPEQDRG